MKYIIGADLGTSACKTVLMKQNGEIVSSITEEYAMDTSHFDWVEFDIHKFYQTFINTCKNCIEKARINQKDICAVGLSGQMVSFIGLDEHAEPVRPMISWMDHRNLDEVQHIKKTFEEQLYEITLNPLNDTFTLPKMLWVKKHEPDVYQRIKKVVLSKDYLRYCLTGIFATDHTDASSTLMYDLRKADWSQEILDHFEIKRSMLPDIYFSCQITGYITKKAATETGLPEGIPVVAGGGDTGCENFSAGIMHEGQCLMRLGTGATIAVPVTEPPIKTNNTCPLSGYYKKNLWLLQGVSQSFGHVMRWLRDQLGQKEILLASKNNRDAYDLICAEASKSPPGSNGLVFNPFITGSPYWKEYLQGGYVCISSAHRYADFLRAAMEGATCALKDAMGVLENLTGKAIEECVLTGGARKSPFWSQMIADILKKRLMMIPDADACTGAAYMAGIGAEVFSTEYLKNKLKAENANYIHPGNGVEENIKVYNRYKKVHDGLDAFYSEFNR
jgi:xylulokinase